MKEAINYAVINLLFNSYFNFIINNLTGKHFKVEQILLLVNSEGRPGQARARDKDKITSQH